jgi:hypothetical protein
MLAMNKQDVGHEEANPITQMIWANTLLTLFLAVPSLTVMVLLRRKIGYRTLKGLDAVSGFRRAHGDQHPIARRRPNILRRYCAIPRTIPSIYTPAPSPR